VEDLQTAQPGTESFNVLKAVQAEKQAKNEDPKQITQHDLGAYLKGKYQIRDHQYMTACSTCHR
jgi:hypothetical protein